MMGPKDDPTSQNEEPEELVEPPIEDAADDDDNDDIENEEENDEEVEAEAVNVREHDGEEEEEEENVESEEEEGAEEEEVARNEAEEIGHQEEAREEVNVQPPLVQLPVEVQIVEDELNMAYNLGIQQGAEQEDVPVEMPPDYRPPRYNVPVFYDYILMQQGEEIAMPGVLGDEPAAERAYYMQHNLPPPEDQGDPAGEGQEPFVPQMDESMEEAPLLPAVNRPTQEESAQSQPAVEQINPYVNPSIEAENEADAEASYRREQPEQQPAVMEPSEQIGLMAPEQLQHYGAINQPGPSWASPASVYRLPFDNNPAPAQEDSSDCVDQPSAPPLGLCEIEDIDDEGEGDGDGDYDEEGDDVVTIRAPLNPDDDLLENPSDDSTSDTSSGSDSPRLHRRGYNNNHRYMDRLPPVPARFEETNPNERKPREIILPFQLHRVSYQRYSGKHPQAINRFTNVHAMQAREARNGQFLVLRLQNAAIVTRLFFDERIFEHFYANFTEAVHRQHSDRASTKMPSAASLLCYIIRTVRFYGGVNEECTLELNASLTDHQTIMTGGGTADRPETRVVHQIDLAHTIGENQVLCQYIKLVFPVGNQASGPISSYANYDDMHPLACLYENPSTLQLQRLNQLRSERFGVFQATAWSVLVEMLKHQSMQQNNNRGDMSLSPAFLEMIGIVDRNIVGPAYGWFNRYRYQQSIRYILKYLRQQNLTTEYELLENNSGVMLESPRLNELYQDFVVKGDYEAAERFLLKAHQDGLFESYIRRCTDYECDWKLISEAPVHPPMDPTAEQSRTPPYPSVSSLKKDEQPVALPEMRAGHAMVIDTEDNKVYLFGGFNGEQDLNDLWCFDTITKKWTMIPHTNRTPTSRSCPQMCIDVVRKRIYMMGKYVEAYDYRTDYRNDLYMYDIYTQDWMLLSEDTFREHGPGLLVDHQMVLDPVSNKLYVFGGVIQTRECHGTKLSEFFCYDLDKLVWSLVRFDYRWITRTVSQSSQYFRSVLRRIYRQFGNCYPQHTFHSRANASVVLHERHRALYIVGGRREGRYFTDVLIYYLEEDQLVPIVNLVLNLPADFLTNGYHIKANWDPDTDEIFCYTCVTSAAPVPGVGNCRYGNISPDEHNIPEVLYHHSPGTAFRFSIKTHVWALDLKYRNWCNIFHIERSYSSEATMIRNADGTPMMCNARNLALDRFMFSSGATRQVIEEGPQEAGLDFENDIEYYCRTSPFPPYEAPVVFGDVVIQEFQGLRQPPPVDDGHPQQQPVYMPPAALPPVAAMIGVNPLEQDRPIRGGGGGGGGVFFRGPIFGDGIPAIGGNVAPIIHRRAEVVNSHLNNSRSHNRLPSFSAIGGGMSEIAISQMNREAFTGAVLGKRAKPKYGERDNKPVPRPRFATAVVYDHKRKEHYMFGGNPNRNCTLRLSDMWQLKLNRLSSQDILKWLIRYLRHAKYLTLLDQNKKEEAAIYLRNKLQPCLDGSNPDDKELLKNMSILLFDSSRIVNQTTPQMAGSSNQAHNGQPVPEWAVIQPRTKMYDYLMQYFPEDMVQPRDSLEDLVMSMENCHL